MKVKCNKITKKITGYAKSAASLNFNQETDVILDISHTPDMENERLNDTNDGLRPITQAEIDTDANIEKETLALQHASSPALEAAIEEFTAILTAASISIPVDVKANITARIRGKL